MHTSQCLLTLHPISRWRTTGVPGLYNVDGGFNVDTGRFIAPQTAAYFCFAQLRLDGASSTNKTTFRLLLGLNGQRDVRNGEFIELSGWLAGCAVIGLLYPSMFVWYALCCV